MRLAAARILSSFLSLHRLLSSDVIAFFVLLELETGLLFVI